MDDDNAGLVRQLCAQAGMILEDASATAILVGGKSPAELRAIIDDLQVQATRINALLAAAKAILL